METTKPLAAAALLLFAVSLIVVASGQDQKAKPECETPPSSLQSQPQDQDFSLGLTEDPNLAAQEFVKKKASPTLAVFGAIPRNLCEVKNVFHIIEGTVTLQPTETDLVNIRECISPLVSLVNATADETRSADGFKSFLERSDAAYIAVLGHTENGILRFPDGSSSSLTEMARQCAVRGKRCILPECITGPLPSHGPGTDPIDSFLCARDPTDQLRQVRSLIGHDSNGVSLAELVVAIRKTYYYPVRYLADKSIGHGTVVALILSVDSRPRRDPKLEFDRTSVNSQGADTRCFPLNFPRPNYTEDARRHKVQGTVRVRILVGADGKVKKVTVVSGLPDGLNEEAIWASYKIRFRPAMKAGVPVEIWQAVDIDFNLR